MLLLPLLLLLFPLYDLRHQIFVIFPAKDLPDRFRAYTDRGFSGNSVIEQFSYADGIINLQYSLRQGASSPKVFTILNLGTPEQPFDASPYKSLSIKVRESTNRNIQLYLKTFLPGVSSPLAEKAVTLRHNEYLLRLNPGAQTYTVSLTKFQTGSWWLNTMNENPATLPAEDFRKLISLDLQFNLGGNDDMLDRKQQVIIEGITLNRPLSFLSKLSFGLLGLLYSALGILVIMRRFRRAAPGIPEQHKLKILSYRKQDFIRVLEFIKAHYNDPAISTRMLYKALGIPPEKVFALVSGEYGLTFKQLINRMRIAEAKRLLGESDLRITDIALNVGFNELTYFNRLFKKYTKMTPSDFRDKVMIR